MFIYELIIDTLRTQVNDKKLRQTVLDIQKVETERKLSVGRLMIRWILIRNGTYFMKKKSGDYSGLM